MSEETSPQAKADLDRIEEACRQLSEHFDSVHIFATRYEPGTERGTVHLSTGLGNWFARYGQVRDWIIRNEERSREKVRNEEPDDDDDGD